MAFGIGSIYTQKTVLDNHFSFWYQPVEKRHLRYLRLQ